MEKMNICNFILSTGFSSNEYRPLHLKCCLYSFITFFLLLPPLEMAGYRSWGRGEADLCICGFFFFFGDGGCLTEVLPFAPCFHCLSLGSASLCTSLRSTERRLHCYITCWGCRHCWTASAAPFSVLPAPMPLLLTFTAHIQMTQCAITQTFHIDQGILLGIIVVQLLCL